MPCELHLKLPYFLKVKKVNYGGHTWANEGSQVQITQQVTLLTVELGQIVLISGQPPQLCQVLLLSWAGSTRHWRRNQDVQGQASSISGLWEYLSVEMNVPNKVWGKSRQSTNPR